MIHTLHTKDNFIYAYTVFRTVNQFGIAQNKSYYIYVEEIWIHPEYRNRKVLRELIDHIDNHEETINALWVYWKNEKHDRVSKTFSRDRFIKKEKLCISQ